MTLLVESSFSMGFVYTLLFVFVLLWVAAKWKTKLYKQPNYLSVEAKLQLLANSSMADSMGSRVYCCFKCQNHVALHDDIISKDFQASNGRAFLFSHAMNIKERAKEDRQLITGLHTVADVFCSDCGEELGWKYIRAYEQTQKYKEGKFILEKFKISR